MCKNTYRYLLIEPVVYAELVIATDFIAKLNHLSSGPLKQVVLRHTANISLKPVYLASFIQP